MEIVMPTNPGKEDPQNTPIPNTTQKDITIEFKQTGINLRINYFVAEDLATI